MAAAAAAKGENSFYEPSHSRIFMIPTQIHEITARERVRDEI